MAHHGPQLFADVGREGREQQDERLHRRARTLVCREEVDELHHPRDRRIEAQLLESCVTALMVLWSVRFCSSVGGTSTTASLSTRLGSVVDDQPPDAIEEIADAVTPVMLQGLVASSGPMNIS